MRISNVYYHRLTTRSAWEDFLDRVDEVLSPYVTYLNDPESSGRRDIGHVFRVGGRDVASVKAGFEARRPARGIELESVLLFRDGAEPTEVSCVIRVDVGERGVPLNWRVNATAIPDEDDGDLLVGQLLGVMEDAWTEALEGPTALVKPGSLTTVGALTGQVGDEGMVVVAWEVTLLKEYATAASVPRSLLSQLVDEVTHHPPSEADVLVWKVTSHGGETRVRFGVVTSG